MANGSTHFLMLTETLVYSLGHNSFPLCPNECLNVVHFPNSGAFSPTVSIRKEQKLPDEKVDGFFLHTSVIACNNLGPEILSSSLFKPSKFCFLFGSVNSNAILGKSGFSHFGRYMFLRVVCELIINNQFYGDLEFFFYS